MEIGKIDHEEVILRRTIHVLDVPETLSDSDLSNAFISCGKIEQLRFEKSADGLRMAFVQFHSEEAANAAVRVSKWNVHGHSLRVSFSRITVDVIPPTDAVFGKPITLGRHVMAVNPSLNRHRMAQKREACFHASCKEAANVLEAIAKRTGWHVSPAELERLRGATSNNERFDHD
jgi:hypothetical protein